MDKNSPKGVTHVVTAADVTATEIELTVPDFVGNVNGAVVQVVTSAGVPKAWDGATVISGKVVTIDNTGSTDWAATDVVHAVLF